MGHAAPFYTASKGEQKDRPEKFPGKFSFISYFFSQFAPILVDKSFFGGIIIAFGLAKPISDDHGGARSGSLREPKIGAINKEFATDRHRPKVAREARSDPGPHIHSD